MRKRNTGDLIFIRRVKEVLSEERNLNGDLKDEEGPSTRDLR